MYQLKNSHSLKSTPPPLAKVTDTTIQPANSMMYLEEKEKMMQQDLQFLVSNLRKLRKQVNLIESQFQKAIDNLKFDLDDLDEITSILGYQSDEDDEDWSCSNYQDS
jgi:hypothetical protein